MDPTASTSSWHPQQSALDDATGEALRNQQEANMVFGAFAAASSGLVPDANTNWEYGAGGLPLSELSCGKYLERASMSCLRLLLLRLSSSMLACMQQDDRGALLTSIVLRRLLPCASSTMRKSKLSRSVSRLIPLLESLRLTQSVADRCQFCRERNLEW